MEIKLFIIGCILLGLAIIMQLTKKKFIKTPKAQKVYENVYSWVDTGWSALIIASIIMYFIIQAFKIPTGSMRMTLLEGDHLFATKFIYGLRVPFSDGKRILPIKNVKKGNIVIFQCPPEALNLFEKSEGIKKDYIKRCIALAGDKVQIKNKVLFVNDMQINEPYAQFIDSENYETFNLFETQEEYQKSWQEGKFATLPPAFVRDNFGPVIVPEGHYMVLGDNRDYSFDSRYWGPLPDKYLKGQALIVYWPIKRIKYIS
ncbi:MAG: signal peptidase I [Endomicrobiia bacterium]|nr:signal peptidase I [Endomicrobiaceae bacterium]